MLPDQKLVTVFYLHSLFCSLLACLLQLSLCCLTNEIIRLGKTPLVLNISNLLSKANLKKKKVLFTTMTLKNTPLPPDMVHSQGMQLQAITGWSSSSLIPKTMDHFWKYRLHLYSHINLCANTLFHMLYSWGEHTSVQCLTRTHSNAIWDVQRSSTRLCSGELPLHHPQK